MKQATFIKTLKSTMGDARLYALTPSIRGIFSHVVVSGVTIPELDVCETYIFPADSQGNVRDWVELEGSFRGRVDHAMALQNAGYEIVRAS